jgi:hypothetical protein
MKDKISITLEERLMRAIDVMRGDVPRSKFIENHLKASTGFFEALWIFADELNRITRREILTAHVSQPVGKPLYRHEGFITLQDSSLDFYDKEFIKLFSVPRSKIKGLTVGYDKDFKRFQHSRGVIPPMHFIFDRKKLYLFTKPVGNQIFRGENPFLQSQIK